MIHVMVIIFSELMQIILTLSIPVLNCIYVVAFTGRDLGKYFQCTAAL